MDFQGAFAVSFRLEVPLFLKICSFFQVKLKKEPPFWQKPQVPTNGNVLGDTVTDLGLNKRPESPLNKRIQLKMCIMYTLDLHDGCFDWKCTFLERMKDTWK